MTYVVENQGSCSLDTVTETQPAMEGEDGLTLGRLNRQTQYWTRLRVECLEIPFELSNGGAYSLS